MRRFVPLRIVVLCAGLLAALVYGRSRLAHTLFELDFVSGWLLALGLAVVAWIWWTPAQGNDSRNGGGDALVRRMRSQLGLAALLLVVFGVHLKMELPVGWIETALFVLFVVLIASTVTGAALAFDPKVDDARRARWMRRHVPLSWSLLGLALFHGVFVHLHGALAHYFL